MAKVVHENQQCSIAGRKILNHYLHFIKDIITNTQEKRTHAAIISLDQKIHLTESITIILSKNITAPMLGTQMETWIKTLYRKPQTQILVNHTLSEPVTLTRSIRQECSLSPLLYVLTIEPSLEYIRQKITDIDIPSQKKGEGCCLCR